MVSGNLELLQVVASWLATIPVAAFVIVRDERRLAGEALARAWPPVSRDAALFGLYLGMPPVCVLVHFVRTRRSAFGWLLGFAWLAAVIGVNLGAQLGVEAAVQALGL